MKAFAYICLLLLVSGCAERELPVTMSENAPPQIEPYVSPNVLTPGSTHAFVARVTDPQGIDDVSRVELLFQFISSTAPDDTISLYDDGGAIHPSDGDVVAFDGFFSQNVLWQQPSRDVTSVVVWFRAVDQEGLEGISEPDTLFSLSINPPVLHQFEAPDRLVSGFEGQVRFVATVSDSSGLEDIETVEMLGLQNNATRFSVPLSDDGRDGDEQAGDGRFTFAAERSFAIGKTGHYDLSVYAVDRSGSSSDTLHHTLQIENAAPRVLQVTRPDSIRRPEADSIIYVPIFIQVEDDQTLEDISLVRMKWQKPDGSFPSSGPYSELFDNGRAFQFEHNTYLDAREVGDAFDFEKWTQGYRGDEEMGDGIYTTTGAFDGDDLLGVYTLTFQARDYTGQFSSEIVRTITLVEE